MTTLQTILDSLKATGCTLPEIDLLQPADAILDTAGEDLRRRIFITQENSGRMLCLRPEFTIPVCLQHLEAGRTKARYAYGGNVFRQRKAEAQEFVQAGFENLGSRDSNDADIDCLLTALNTLEAAGQKNLSLVLGDQAIFLAALEALEIPKAWRKKLVRSFGDTDLLNANLDAMSNEAVNGLPDLPDEIHTALETREQEKVVPIVTEQMARTGLPLTGGRTAKAISERMIEKAELASERLDTDKRAALEKFLNIDVDLADAADAIGTYENENGIMLPLAKEELSARHEGLHNANAKATYRAGYGRRLDYYTGMVFGIFREGLEDPLVGGGRYDHLLTLLGSPEEIPAVGFSIWVDRLEGAGT